MASSSSFVMGYPQLSNTSGNQPIYPLSSETRPKKTCTCVSWSICAIVCAIFLCLYGLVISAMIIELNRYPYFRVEYASVALNNTSGSSTRTMADWEIGLSVYNPNSANVIDFKDFEVSVKSLLGSSVAVLPDFQQHHTVNRTILNVSVHGALPHFNNGTGARLPFDVNMKTNLRFLNWLHIEDKLSLYRSACTGLEIWLEDSQTKGTLLGGPVECKEELIARSN